MSTGSWASLKSYEGSWRCPPNFQMRCAGVMTSSLPLRIILGDSEQLLMMQVTVAYNLAVLRIRMGWPSVTVCMNTMCSQTGDGRSQTTKTFFVVSGSDGTSSCQEDVVPDLVSELSERFHWRCEWQGGLGGTRHSTFDETSPRSLMRKTWRVSGHAEPSCLESLLVSVLFEQEVGWNPAEGRGGWGIHGLVLNAVNNCNPLPGGLFCPKQNSAVIHILTTSIKFAFL